MRILKYGALLTLSAGLFFGVAPKTQAAQVSINIGPEPVCPYGYYDYAPYPCAPYGYYGPEWFTGGVFFGAGPWFHGPHGFRGHVDNHYDMHRGYHGALPQRGERPTPEHQGPPPNFHGNEMRDGRGHVVRK